MVEKNKKNKHTTELLFMILLFFIFGLCALFTVLIGGQVYQNIGKRIEGHFTGVTTLSYISNKVKQADSAGLIEIRNIGQTQVLCLQQEIQGDIYETMIYYDAGFVKELFCQKDSGLTLKDGIEIIESEGLFFAIRQPNLLEVQTQGQGAESLLLALRSGVSDNG